MSAEDGKIHIASLPHLGGELLPVRHDSHHARAERLDARLRLGQRVDADAAIGAPVAAMERDDDGSMRQQIFQTDQPAGFVGKHERRHQIAGLGRLLAGVMLLRSG